MSILSYVRTTATVTILAIIIPFFIGCASDKDSDIDYVEQPVEELYNYGMDLMIDKEYTKAIKELSTVEQQHPYSKWAVRSQLMVSYAYYELNKFDDAIDSLNFFIQLHPGNKDVDYAYYLKALCYYEQIPDVERDQKSAELAFKSLQELIDRFPNSTYARAARLKLDLVKDHLAGKEMLIGRQYESKKQYLAAINRYSNVINDFQNTNHVSEALYRLIECYEILGLSDEAKKIAAILGHNYPGDLWYSNSYKLIKAVELENDFKLNQKKKDDSWFNRPYLIDYADRPIDP
ncbi:MAG: outer membrane protein assembly factor BamD [Rhodospirillaceae bacterium]|jgi:outer membrane protein assembly factor BamD|nr:outer membrane protein assembly factor BamD [Rhodospirillaceae bacterium]